jgi:hypothetical protein
VKYKQTAWSFGLGVNKVGELCIQNNHYQVKKITGAGSGYAKVLKRHPLCNAEKSTKGQGFTPMQDIEKARQCTYIGGVLETDDVPF